MSIERQGLALGLVWMLALVTACRKDEPPGKMRRDLERATPSILATAEVAIAVATLPH